MTPIATCGCVCDISDLQSAKWAHKIVFCPLHAAAQEMLNVLKDATENRPTTMPWMRSAVIVVAKAEGRHEV